MLMRVYHAKPFVSEDHKFPQDYKFVAHASAAETLEEAVELTTHGKHPWYKGIFVQPADDTVRYRSTTVGDVIVDKDRNAWRVEQKGFKKIEYDPVHTV